MITGQAPGRWSPLQVRMLLLCAAVMFCDGFDLLAISYAAPMIRHDLGLDLVQMGRIFSVGLIGTIVGGALLGPAADRFGAKRVVALSLTLAGLATAAAALANTAEGLLLCRALTGVGVGGAMPVAFTLAADYAPAARRRTVMALVGLGFSLGGASAGLFSSLLLERLGWHALFQFGGLFSLAVAALVLFWGTEGLSFLSARGADDRLRALMRSLPQSVSLAASKPAGGRSEPWAVFGRSWRTLTFALWSGSFLMIFAYYLVVNWLPSATARGADAVTVGVIALAWLQVGQAVGGVAVGVAMDRFDGLQLVGFAAVATAATATAAATLNRPELLIVLSCMLGFFQACGQGGINYLAASVYPSHVRSTSIAWTISIGRFGGIIAPLVGSGIMLGPEPLPHLFLGAAIAAGVAGMVILSVAAFRREPT